MKARRAIVCLAFTALLWSARPIVAAEADKPAIGASVQSFVDRHALAGAVMLVADKDRVLDVETVGFMDVGAKTPTRKDALFWIASQSKPITVTALMMLVDEGKVSLDDPIEKFLPEFRDVWVAVEQDNDHQLLKRPARKVVVRDILSHTSGMRFSSPIEEPTLDQRPLAERVLSYAFTPLATQPGEKYAYSNAGINTGGRIVEVVSGMAYEDFLQKRLFDPLGMKDTTFWPTKVQQERLAKSYKPNANKTDLDETTVTQLRYPLDDKGNRFPMPAGGLFSTAEDVGRFCRMLLNDGMLDGKQYLSEKSVREMSKKQTPDAIKESYGLGFSVSGDGSFGHGGAYATNMTIDPKRGLVTVWMVQHAGFPLDGNKAQGEFQHAANERFGKRDR